MTPTITDRQLDKRGLFEMLGYRPHPGQLLVHRSNASRRVLACGCRWGKTVSAAHEAVAEMLRPRGRSLGWIVAPSYDLADRAFGLVVEIVERALRHRIREISAREQRIVLTNLSGGRSEVRGKSADRPSSLLGEGLDWLVVDEAAQLPREVWESYLSQRLVDRRGWALFLSTPRGGGWFYSLYRQGQAGRDPSFESWSSPSSANPYLDQAALEAERLRLPDEVFRQEYLAEFITADEEPCAVCGFPVPEANAYIVLLVGQEMPECSECQRPVDDRGRCIVLLGPNGTASSDIKCLVLPSKPPTEPSDPEWNAAWIGPVPTTMGELLSVDPAPSIGEWMGWS